MALTTFTRSIPQRLQDTFAPVTDDAFAEILARIVARFEGASRVDTPAVCRFSRGGMSRRACIVFVEMVATAAALDGLALSDLQYDDFDGEIEVTLTLKGAAATVAKLSPMIEASGWPS